MHVNAGAGLQVGDRAVFASRLDDGGRVVSTTQPALMALVPEELVRGTAWASAGLRYRGQRLLFGDKALEGRELAAVSERLSWCGRGSIHRSEAEAALGAIVEELLGPAPVVGAPCVVAQPSPAVGGSDSDASFTETIVRDILRKLGYSAHFLEEGRAVAICEMQETDTALLAFFAHDRQVQGCLSAQGIMGVSFAVEPSGGAVDEQVATTLEISRDEARTLRAECNSVIIPHSRQEQALALACRALLDRIFTRLLELFEKQGTPSIDQPIDVVWSGTWRAPQGFGELLLRSAKELEFPIPLRQVRFAESPETVVARGCLRAAQSF